MENRTIINALDIQLQFFTQLLERDLDNGYAIYDYFVNENGVELLDWKTLKNYLTVTKLEKLHYLEELVQRCENYIDIYNSFDNSIIKKFDKPFQFTGKGNSGWTEYEFRMLLLREDQIHSLPSHTDNLRNKYLKTYTFNNYDLHFIGQRCQQIRSVILGFYPELIKDNNPYPDIFRKTEDYLIFKEFTDNHIIDHYLDYSFLFHKMLNEKRLFKIKHFNFMQWLQRNGFITEKVLDLFISKKSFYNGCNSAQRVNNYELIVKLIKS
ncbi:MAG: hypothetical protein ACON5F_02310 [Jejuia sp.]